MAKSENTTGTVIQSGVTPRFALEIKELADQDGRSVSNLIKLALRDRLQASSSASIAASGGRNQEPSGATSSSAGRADHQEE